ncbi:heterochromatin organization [Nesidiocoris tenuis]|uniref:Heterochromatin organization n=1 Tax=Nesidiocoris tenuis TaxID=355587 RepID=A0ABN7AMH8_9HEMI|nr:heterochromatin organization [Nesidiocoris tenuis]
MTAQYSIGVSTNRFELFDLGDEDPLELIQKQEQEKEAKKKAKLVEKDVKPKPTTPAAPKGKSEKVKSQNSGGGGGHDSHKAKDEPLKTVGRGDERKANADFKGPRGDRDHGGQGNYRGGDRDHEKENYRSREDQDRGRDMTNDDGGFRKGDFGGRGGDRPRGGGRGGGNAFRGRTFQRGGGGPGGRQFGGGEGGERGGERGGGGYRGKREFDRQSGSNRTGVKPMEKRNGSGNYNWGTVKDDWNATNEEELNSSNDKENWDTSNNDPNPANGPDEWTGPTDANAQWNPETGPKGDGTAPALDGADPNAPPAPTGDNPENPDAPTDTGTPKEELTLDEWKAKKGPKAAPSYNLRKAGEGEDLTQWKKMYALRKKKDEEDEEDEEYEYIEIPQRVGRQRHVLDIDIRYKDSRGGNVGRGRGRGRGGFRGPPREDRAAPGGPGGGGPGGPSGPGAREPGGPGGPPHSGPPKEAPKVDDEHDFPSLS